GNPGNPNFLCYNERMIDDFSTDVLTGIENEKHVPLSSLMPKRVHDLLLVSSMYDSYTFEEDGRLTEILFSQYVELNLRNTPRIRRVSTAEEALEKLKTDHFDLVISMLRVGGMDIADFSRRVKEIDPDLPVVLLAYQTRELSLLQARQDLPGIDRIFVWHGDVRLFLAIIKYIEDRMNVSHDSEVAGVQSIILLEDNISFYSSYLPMLYTEVVLQTQALMAEGLNITEKVMRMQARPKILLATSYEEGSELYGKFQEHILGVVVDVSLPKGGEPDPEAGLEFARRVREETWDRAVLVQSSDERHRKAALELGAHFINKNSPTLLHELREFMRENLGFGDFLFKRPDDGSVVARAGDLRSLLEALKTVPDDSLLFHVRRNHFSRWLMARTEFDLARALRPRKVEEFRDPSEIREYLISKLTEHLGKKSSGVVIDFPTGTFDPSSMFLRIGSGSLGGKGRGLAFLNSILNKLRVEKQIPHTRIFVPPTAVLTTEIFDSFMDLNNLTSLVLSETDDGKIRDAFLGSRLPDHVTEQLREFLKWVKYPLAARSSSLLEDASYQPFAGIYRTYMLPNNHEDLAVRLEELSIAIKLVYASTYFSDPRSYFEATPNRLEEEKMAVVIQEIVGRHHENYIYPDLAGVARSRDFYTMEGMDPKDGVAAVALGLGKTVVEGGKCVRFSPAYPQKLFQFSTVEDYLENSQREFFALDMAKSAPIPVESQDTDANLVLLGTDAAERHGTLGAIGSTYIPENEAVYDGIGYRGIRLITMAGILKHSFFPLAEAVKYLLKIGTMALSCPVEIEFAVNLNGEEDLNELAFLQIRPLVAGPDAQDIALAAFDPVNTICISKNALGQGLTDDINNIVYVRDDNFDRSKTVEIAGEIETVNDKMRQAGRFYILIGPGRWGTSDTWAGIPVTWYRISGARCIVETDMKGITISPSQGTHFFHNITSFGIPYFTVNYDGKGDSLDMDWLNSQTPIFETPHVRLLEFDKPAIVAVSGKKRMGIILKPGIKLG
ncbi:MAG: PEP/pyruvate-binding domain-containing protein, partial [bacterium]